MYVFYFKRLNAFAGEPYKLVAVKGRVLPMVPVLGENYDMGDIAALIQRGYRVVVDPTAEDVKTADHITKGGERANAFGYAGRTITVEDGVVERMHFAPGYRSGNPFLRSFFTAAKRPDIPLPEYKDFPGVSELLDKTDKLALKYQKLVTPEPRTPDLRRVELLPRPGLSATAKRILDDTSLVSEPRIVEAPSGTMLNPAEVRGWQEVEFINNAKPDAPLSSDSPWALELVLVVAAIAGICYFLYHFFMRG